MSLHFNAAGINPRVTAGQNANDKVNNVFHLLQGGGADVQTLTAPDVKSSIYNPLVLTFVTAARTFAEEKRERSCSCRLFKHKHTRVSPQLLSRSSFQFHSPQLRAGRLRVDRVVAARLQRGAKVLGTRIRDETSRGWKPDDINDVELHMDLGVQRAVGHRPRVGPQITGCNAC